MSFFRGIVPVRGKWKVHIKKIDGVSLQFDIDQVNFMQDRIDYINIQPHHAVQAYMIDTAPW